MKSIKTTLAVLMALLLLAVPGFSLDTEPVIGDSLGGFQPAPGNEDIRGMAFDEISPESPRLLVLDGSGKIFAYRPAGDTLELQKTYDLPKAKDGSPLTNPRGLAYAIRNKDQVFYFLNWEKNGGTVKSELWQYNVEGDVAGTVDLTLFPLRIGDREVLDLAYDNGNIFISFDATGYRDYSLRIRRGIIQVRWNQANEDNLDFVKHMPDSGEQPSLGLTYMEFEGARYLWGTVGDEYIYSADARTGRGIFHFPMPESDAKKEEFHGLAYGSGDLWIAECLPGPDRIQRINVTRNLDAPKIGPRILRHLTMTITTEPEGDHPDPGKVYHNYSRPYSYEQLGGNQGTSIETEKIYDLSDVPNAKIKKFTYDPGEDEASRQYMNTVEYENAPARSYSSKYEIDIWTSSWRKFVYPHRVNRNIESLKGTDYLADDPFLFDLKDNDTYDDFFKRVKEHITAKYGMPADMESPYWAARNCLEYIQDHYYYPGREKRKPAAVDYDRKHYDANPGNLKIDLSRGGYDKNQIIACSGTSVMLAGAMRYLGFEARWLGTGTEFAPGDWDTNGNNLLDEGETAGVSSGHRYTQVWLGDNYGWICFDGTPTRPDFNDYDPIPPVQTQWRYMNRSAAGHLKDKRIVFNVGSGWFEPLTRDFEYDEKLAVDNNCGGDQRYNLQGRFDKPELWKLARQRIQVTNVCFINEITVSKANGNSTVSFQTAGDWDKDPEAEVTVSLQRIDTETGRAEDVAVLADNIRAASGSVNVDLSGYSGPGYRIMIRKVGDPETGGHSAVFELN